MADDITVGVLSLHNSKETKAILNAVDEMGYGTEWLREENTSVEVHDGDLVLEPNVDVIANRMLLSNVAQPAERLGLATMFGRLRPMLNDPIATLTALHKFASAAALSEAGLPVPDALLALDSGNLNAGRERFGTEAVYKTAIGTHGGGTWKVDLGDPVNAKVGERYAFLQEFVEHDEKRHHDLRVYVVGEEVIGAMNRYAPEDDWRTNVALGGDVEDASDLPEEVAQIAQDATDVVGLDYAGVDIVEGEDGWKILEVNPTAGFKGFYKATGTSPAPFIARLAIERAGGSVDGEDIERISARLDDSRPACMPYTEETKRGEPASVGYIEEVIVSGTRGSKSVLAKSDTGANRTSIDTELAAEIGTGPIKDTVRIRSGSVKSGKSRPIVDVVVGVAGNQHTVTASVEDRSHMNYPLLLGRDILGNYHVDVSRRADREEQGREREQEE